MEIFYTIDAFRRYRATLLEKIALVPTMGNLHEGHLDLVRQAKKMAEKVVVSIFVNPTQFGEGEDFSTYPRTFTDDCEKLKALGVDAIFAPKNEEIYPSGQQSVFVVPSKIKDELCGVTRKEHFEGVATVVSKLFNIIQPHLAIFGEKDYQQLFIIREMIRELNFPVEALGVPTHRENSMLALSSRNQYLTEEEREEAAALYYALNTIKEKILSGKKVSFRALEKEAIASLSKQGWRVDYISIRYQETLIEAETHDAPLVVLGAAFFGKPRLIDNIKIN